MAALCEMKLNLQLAKREGTWLLWSPEAEIPLAYEEELEDEDGQEILRLLGRRWTRPQRVLVRYAEPHGPELFVRDRPAGQRAELPGQARPQDTNPEFRLKKKMEDSLWEQPPGSSP